MTHDGDDILDGPVDEPVAADEVVTDDVTGEPEDTVVDEGEKPVAPEEIPVPPRAPDIPNDQISVIKQRADGVKTNATGEILE